MYVGFNKRELKTLHDIFLTICLYDASSDTRALSYSFASFYDDTKRNVVISFIQKRHSYRVSTEKLISDIVSEKKKYASFSHSKLSKIKDEIKFNDVQICFITFQHKNIFLRQINRLNV